MAKKKTAKKKRKPDFIITPEISQKREDSLKIEDLESGDYFLFDDCLWVIIDCDPFAYNLTKNHCADLDYDDGPVILVKVEIKWTKK